MWDGRGVNRGKKKQSSTKNPAQDEKSRGGGTLRIRALLPLVKEERNQQQKGRRDAETLQRSWAPRIYRPGA